MILAVVLNWNIKDKIYFRTWISWANIQGIEVGKEFGLRSLFNYFNIQIEGQSAKVRHLQLKQAPKPAPYKRDIIESAFEDIIGTTSKNHTEDDILNDKFRYRVQSEEKER